MTFLCVIIIFWSLGYVLYYLGYFICVIITFVEMDQKARKKRKDLKEALECANRIREYQDSLGKNNWVCPHCYALNANYVGTCKCGKTRW